MMDVEANLGNLILLNEDFPEELIWNKASQNRNASLNVTITEHL